MGRRWVIRMSAVLVTAAATAGAQTEAAPSAPAPTGTASFPEPPAAETAPPPIPESAAPTPTPALPAPPPVSSPPPVAPTAPVPAQPPVNPHARRHDGFFFRIATGLGYIGDSVSSTAFDSASFRGFGTADELSFGGTVARGLVIGGGFQDVLVFQPRLVIDGSDARRPAFLGLSMVGAFGDYYFDPARGLHAQLFLGLSLLQADESRAEEDPAGFGASVAFGDDFWVSDEWSIGVLGRLSFAALVFDPAGYDERHVVVAPALLATFTYH